MSHQVGKISQRELERKMRTKLLTHGFDSGISNVIIDAMDLKEDKNAQTEALKKQELRLTSVLEIFQKLNAILK